MEWGQVRDRSMGLVDAGAEVALLRKVRNGSPPFAWFVSGAPVRREVFARTRRWVPDRSGFATLSVVDGRGLSSRVSVYLD